VSNTIRLEVSAVDPRLLAKPRLCWAAVSVEPLALFKCNLCKCDTFSLPKFPECWLSRGACGSTFHVKQPGLGNHMGTTLPVGLQRQVIRREPELRTVESLRASCPAIQWAFSSALRGSCIDPAVLKDGAPLAVEEYMVAKQRISGPNDDSSRRVLENLRTFSKGRMGVRCIAGAKRLVVVLVLGVGRLRLLQYGGRNRR
jgi:hypothetical protein